jgi:signal recognition particle receptor subunit beta/predicted  nucleic acid-binding Zn-ribbon protein
MVHVNYVNTEMTLKLVYYGPGLCGKTTNLKYIFDHIAPEKRGKMVSLATESDRTLFFDLLPLELGKLHGFKVRLQLFTVPGQVKYNATRKLVLKGVDGLVFVADSQVDMLASNLESQKNLRENLQDEHLELAQLPLVIQYNKRDLPNLLPLEALEQELNPGGRPSFSASAITGQNVLETLREISKLTLNHVRQQVEYAGEREEEERLPVSAATASYPGPAPGASSLPPRAPAPPRPAQTIPPPVAPPLPTPERAPAIPAQELQELRELQQRLQEQLTSLRPPAEPSAPPAREQAAELGELRERLEARLTDVDGLRQDFASLRRDCEIHWTQQDAALCGLQQQLDLLAASRPAAPETAELRASVAALSARLDGSQAQLADVSKVAARQAELASSVTALRGELEQLLRRQTQLENHLVEVSAQVQKLAGQGSAADRQVLQKRCAELESAVATLRAELETMPPEPPDLNGLELEPEESSPTAEAAAGEVDSFWKRLFKESS